MAGQLEGGQGINKNEQYIHTHYGWCYWTLAPYPLIYGLYIRPKHRKHGHAKTLLIFCIQSIRSSGYDGNIKIEAIPKTKAIKPQKLKEFYEKLGLEVINFV